MVIMGNDGHTPSLPIPFYECGPHNGLRKVRTAECLLGNGVLHQTDTPATRGVSITGTDLSDALL